MRRRLTRLALLLILGWLTLTSMACDGGQVYVGVGVSGPYHGYPHGRGYGYGTVRVGRYF